jgi:hAT family C-terminal dimerisation region
MGNNFDSSKNRANAKENDDSGRVVETLAASVEREIENYLDPDINVSPSTDPLQWWRENRFRFPNTATAARKWLCVPGTSTPSERVFSHCGIALSAKQNSMQGDALMNQILLKNNLSHILCTVEDVKNALSKLE